MKENMHIGNRQILLNMDQTYPRNREVLLSSEPFERFATYFIGQLRESSPEQYAFLTLGGKLSTAEAAKHLVRLLRMLAIFELDEVEDALLEDTDMLLDILEEGYRSWRSLQRFSFMSSTSAPDFGINTLVQRDSNMNDLILRTYRLFEEKLKRRPNLVYRQVQAGTNACFSVHKPEKPFSERYAKLAEIPMIDTVMLRTPMILHPKSSKRTGMFTETDTNPMEYLNLDPTEWFCFPMKVGSKLCFVYFNSKYTASALSLANLFEIATKEESDGKPDLVLIFGNEDGKNATEFYHDKDENIWVGCVSDHPRVEYFGYLKKMALTLHNLSMMEQGWLPIHGAFVNITLKDGRTKGIMLMGDSGAGKSESIEALKAAGKDMIKNIETVFDDMGTIHIEDGVPYGQGTEIGAFVRLDDLDPGTAYRDMDRSIFMGPENKNARMVLPAAPYHTVVANHPIDLFCYANNYTPKLGMSELSVEKVKDTCKQGKRMALGTTQEIGLSTTYFANPFGPMQKQEVCEPIIDEVFEALKKNGTFVGEIYTHLGFDKENREGINDAARALLEFITKE